MNKGAVAILVIMIVVVGVIMFGCNNDNNSYDSGYSSSSFTNKFGTPSTKCAHSGCSKTIAKTGDTNCCTTHSNRCGSCYCYIDEDAMFCMTCIKNAIG